MGPGDQLLGKCQPNGPSAVVSGDDDFWERGTTY